jgi:hypothetical protein
LFLLQLRQTLYQPYFHLTLLPFNPRKKPAAPTECGADWVADTVGRLLEKEKFYFL